MEVKLILNLELGVVIIELARHGVNSLVKG